MISLRLGMSSVRNLALTSLISLNRAGLLGRIMFLVLSTMPGMIGSNMVVAPLAVSNSFAVAIALGDGCCEAAGPHAIQASANAAIRPGRAGGVIMEFLLPVSCNQGRSTVRTPSGPAVIA